MFAILLHLAPLRTAFHEDGGVPRIQGSTTLLREARNAGAERWLVVGWCLILAKCVALWWLIKAYQVPIHPLWLVGPTVLFGLLATAVYIWRD
jgi:hypothetical protein